MAGIQAAMQGAPLANNAPTSYAPSTNFTNQNNNTYQGMLSGANQKTPVSTPAPGGK